MKKAKNHRVRGRADPIQGGSLVFCLTMEKEKSVGELTPRYYLRPQNATREKGRNTMGTEKNITGTKG